MIIRPQAQEIVERVIEQPRTPPPRIIEKEMHEEAPPPIVRTRFGEEISFQEESMGDLE